MSLSDPSALHRFVRKLTPRSSLTGAESGAILALPAIAAQIRTNHDFVRLGEQVEHSTLVVEGLVGRFGQNRDGSRQITALHIAGDMANLNSVVAPEAGAALQALAITTVLRIPNQALRDLTVRFPAITRAFWRESVVDAAVLGEWVVNVGRRDARSRLAHLLCEIAYRHGGEAVGNGFSFAFPATQTHLADMLGLTPVHINRTLRSLRESKLVSLQARVVRIDDWKAMVALGDFESRYLRINGAATDRADAAAA